MRLRIRLASAIVAILAAFTFAAPAAAASPWIVFKEAGTSAVASTSQCVDHSDGTTTCSNQQVDIFRGTSKHTGDPTFKGERVCYTESMDTFGPNTFIESHGNFGCALHGKTLSIKNLTSITLNPTVIDLTHFDCDPTGCKETPGGPKTVEGTWTAFGPVIRQSSKYKFDDGTCRQSQADKSRSRQATFAGTFSAMDARIAKGSFTFKTTCP
jgi:hypothetical protein